MKMQIFDEIDAYPLMIFLSILLVSPGAFQKFPFSCPNSKEGVTLFELFFHHNIFDLKILVHGNIGIPHEHVWPQGYRIDTLLFWPEVECTRRRRIIRITIQYMQCQKLEKILLLMNFGLKMSHSLASI